MLGIIIGFILILFGIYANNILFIMLGIAAAVLFSVYNKPQKINYVQVEHKPRHLVLQSEPPSERFPTPQEIGTPYYEAIEANVLGKERKELKKLRTELKLAKTPEQKDAIQKKIKKTRKGIEGKQHMLSTLPFYPKPKTPLQSAFGGHPLQAIRKAVRKQTDKYEEYIEDK